MKRYDVVALGELLIDFTESGLSEQGNPVFEANPGGAPCNVLAMLRKLERQCAFVGKVGNDMFGHQLKAVAEEAGIDMSALRMDDAVHTTLAFVKTDAYGDRDFSFYRNPGADMMLTEDELPLEMLRDTRIFHFGTLSMTHEAVRQATKAAVLAARENCDLPVLITTVYDSSGKLLTGGTVDSWGDHRIAMMAAIAAPLCRNPVTIRNAEAVKKSYPGFFEDLADLSL